MSALVKAPRLIAALAVIGLLAWSRVASAQDRSGIGVFVVNQGSNSVEVHVIGYAGDLTPVSAVSVGTSPRGLAVRADQSFAYVANAGSNSVSVIDASTLTVVQTVSAGPAPCSVVLRRDGRRLYVANVDDSTISVFDADTTTGFLTPASTFAVPGTGPGGLALSPDNTRLYVTMQFSDTLQVVDTGSHTVTATVPVGSRPVNVTVSPDGSRALVANAGSSTVSIVDTTTNTVTATVSSSAWQVAFSPDGRHYYLSTGADGGVRVYDASTNAYLQTQALSGTIHAVAVDPLGRYLYAADVEHNVVHEVSIDGTTGLLTPRGTAASSVSSPFAVGTCAPGPVETGTVFRVANRTTPQCLGRKAVFNGGTLLVLVDQAYFSDGSSSVGVTLGSGGAVVDTNGHDLAGQLHINGTGGLTKTGEGRLALSGSYTGATTVNAGTLYLDESTGSDITVNSGATLAADEVQGAVTVNSGGTLNRTLNRAVVMRTGGGLTLNSGSTLVLDFYRTNAQSPDDNIVVTGGVAVGGTLSVVFSNWTEPGKVVTIISNDGNDPVHGTFAGLPEGATVTSVRRTLSEKITGFRISYVGGDGNDVTLTKSWSTLSTVASPGVTFGGSIYDTATLANFTSPTGALTFTVYGPDDDTCSDPPAFKGVETVTGNRVYRSHSFTPSAVGKYRWIATYSGDVNNHAASGACNDSNASVTVTKADQTVTFDPIGDRTYGDAPFTVSGSASTGLRVSFARYWDSVGCTVTEGELLKGTATWRATVTIVGAGTCKLGAVVAGDANHNNAGVTRTFNIAKAAQTISFSALPDKSFGSAPFSVSATASSGLVVTFSSQTTSICSVAGSIVTLLAPGTCTIAANQAGSGNYSAAAQVTQSFGVRDCAVVSVAPGQLSLATAGLPYTQALTLTNGAQPVTWSVSGALPPGVTFDDGTFAGTPSRRGVFPVTLTATDGVGCPASATLTLPVSAERRIVAGAGAGAATTVRTFDLVPTVTTSFDAYAPAFTGGVSVAQGDTNGDGVPDLITGAGPGGGPHVIVYDGVTLAARLSFYAFDPGFRSGVEVAGGDVNGDGVADVIVVGGCGTIPVVRVFDGRHGAVLREYAIDQSIWSCGYHVAAGDVTGDGIADIVVGSDGKGSGPAFVQVIDGASGATLRTLTPYQVGFLGGVYVAAGDVTGDGYADIVTGAGPGGGPHVQVFDGKTGHPVAGPLGSFMAYDPAFTGGVRVAAGDLNADGKAEVITAAGPGGGPHVRVFDGDSGSELLGLFAFEPTLASGVFVGGAATLGRMVVDFAGRTTDHPILITGWALREGVGTVGVDAIHAWAYRVGGPSTGSGQAGAPVFVGAASSRIARPDVASLFGGEFLMSGFDITGTLAPGTYDLVVFARNSRTLLFDQVRIVRVTLE